MERVNDPELEKTILAISNHLEPEAASKIDIVIVKDMANLGYFVIHKDKERHWGSCKSYSHILINIKARTMLENEEEKDIVYATLAHEIGHIMTKEDKYFEIDETPFILEWELAADKKALVLLENIYKNPKEILLKQINYAHQTVLKYENATSEDIFLTAELAEKRRNALLEN